MGIGNWALGIGHYDRTTSLETWFLPHGEIAIAHCQGLPENKISQF
ncbi:MAG: hypothetical protein HC785_12110 [Calothrix sp. CSU_2_0]|nr:hypothetical protein [Calothrix sp. CSU_2_0]